MELSATTAGRVKWCKHDGKQLVIPLKIKYRIIYNQEIIFLNTHIPKRNKNFYTMFIAALFIISQKVDNSNVP